MKKASISEAKNGLSALIDRVKAGASILIVDRGRPVARLEPVTTGTAAAADLRLVRLVRDGIVRPARSATPRALIAAPPPRLRRGVSAVDVLLEDRRAGR